MKIDSEVVDVGKSQPPWVDSGVSFMVSNAYMAKLDWKSLAEQLAEKLAKDIASCVWEDFLPGYRKLATNYEVGRETCEEAVRMLEREGIVGPSRLGRMREILLPDGRVSATINRQLLIIVDRISPPGVEDEDVFAGIAQSWEKNGGTVHRVAGDLKRHKRPKAQMTKWINQVGADCLLLYVPPREWVIAAENSGLPCFALGGEIEWGSGVISSCSLSIPDFVCNRLPEALSLGHRKILVILGSSLSQERMQASFGKRINSVLQKEEGSGGLTAVVSLYGYNLPNPDDWHRCWTAILTREQPTLIIVEQVFQAISLHSYCLRTGIQMPRDLSIIVMSESPVLQWLEPALTCYRFPNEKAVAMFRRWVRASYPQGQQKMLTASTAGGTTFGPAPAK